MIYSLDTLWPSNWKHGKTGLTVKEVIDIDLNYMKWMYGTRPNDFSFEVRQYLTKLSQGRDIKEIGGQKAWMY